MKNKGSIFVVVIFLLLLIPVVKGAVIKTKTAEKQLLKSQQEAIIDVAFCLDTTGSMSGLIEGAKQKIWTIVNTVNGAQPRPVLRIALIGYRDRGDDYVTTKFDFTSNLETMYSHLRAFEAGGGGDTPEDVNRALNDAVNGLDWSQEPAALKIVYLVGDAPPHMDYQEGYDYRSITKLAARRGIIVNTVQCGNIDGTREIWQEIARIAEGKFAAIDQSGGMIAIASPYDEELANLSRDLNKTYVAYGSEGGRMLAAQAANDMDAETRAPASAAERAASKAGSLYRNESWDLVDAVNNRSVKLEELKPSELPENLRNMNEKDQHEYLEQKSRDREHLQMKIQDLSKRRDTYVDAKMKQSGKKTDSAFDAQVLNTLKEQGKRKGIAFEK
ncbi:MAG TPA: vWA domain-containing protein [Acidobacteriota bacterium]|nr:vWA domain-containing protein [Acidobacteriota bacterium]